MLISSFRVHKQGGIPMEQLSFCTFEDILLWEEIPPYEKYPNCFHEKWVVKYIEEHKNVIRMVFMGIAEDWSSTCLEYWVRPMGYTNSSSLVKCSAWGRPAISIQFTDGDVLNFYCYYKLLPWYKRVTVALSNFWKRW
jgi:hypothetical protein